MNSVSMDGAAGQVRPSRLIAEALVLGHDAVEVTQRAEEMGLPEGLTRAVVSVCCRDHQESEEQSMLDSGS